MTMTVTPVAADSRVQPRSNMFLSAVLQSPSASVPARIRNMSAGGALVEAPVIPGAAEPLRLVRGRLEVGAQLAWTSGGRCGLRFSCPISIDAWMAPVRNAEQHRVDEAVRLMKLGAVPLQRPAPAERARRDLETEVDSLSEDLRCVARLIENLGADLAGDRGVLVRHAAKLQNLDIAVQTVIAVAQCLSGLEIDGADLARLENLRSSCASALAASR